MHALHQIRSEWYESFSSLMKQMSKWTFVLGFLCWCLVVLLQTEVSSWLLSPKSKRKPVGNYSELWYETQCLPELFVGWCNLHTTVCSSLCLKTLFIQGNIVVQERSDLKPNKFSCLIISLLAFRGSLQLCW